MEPKPKNPVGPNPSPETPGEPRNFANCFGLQRLLVSLLTKQEDNPPKKRDSPDKGPREDPVGERPVLDAGRRRYGERLCQASLHFIKMILSIMLPGEDPDTVTAAEFIRRCREKSDHNPDDVNALDEFLQKGKYRSIGEFLMMCKKNFQTQNAMREEVAALSTRLAVNFGGRFSLLDGGS